ncbi:MAG: ROK family transcriptional regulator [Anaerolineaceae bacterium]|nr:ROK family transcriptional regulator [Anaerolineaceae bacterium]
MTDPSQINAKMSNYSMILNLIRTQGPICRADLAQYTNLSTPTVSTIIDHLTNSHLIINLGPGDSSGGRRPHLYAINPEVRQIIALSLSKTKLTMALMNMNGTIIVRQEKKFNSINKPDNGIQEIIAAIEALILDENINHRDIAYIGVSVPGVVNSGEDITISSPLQWYEVPLGRRLSDHFKLPVMVENDCVAAVWAEHEIGAGQGKNHIVSVLGQNTGVGLGIILNGQVYKGITDMAGEIGHMVVEENGPRCTCGNFGCLQVTANPAALVKQALEAIEDGVDTEMARMCQGDTKALTLEIVINALSKGDRVAFNLVDRLGTYLGGAIAKVVHILNPSTVIIGGDFAAFGQTILESVRRPIKASVLSHASNALEVILSPLGQDASLRGIALLCSEKWLSETALESEEF